MEERRLEKLRRMLGPGCFLDTKEELLAHSHDATGSGFLPEAVVLPESVEQVSAVARFCTEEGIPLTPRGGGTGLSGGCVPLMRGVSLSFARMKSVREIVPEDLYVIVEPGIITEQLEKALEAHSLFYPPVPTSHRASTIGGNIGTSASGLHSGKYGTTKNYLMGLELVLPTGETMRTGARTVKSVAGYDLTRLVCGSQGTLAIVTSAILKLLPLPEHRVTILAAFATAERAAEASVNVISNGLTPSVLEFMDSFSTEVLSKNVALPVETAHHALVLAETDGFREAAEKEAVRIEGLFRNSGAVFVEKIEKQETTEKLWEARKNILKTLAGRKPAIVLEDITVPRSRIVAMLRSVTEIGKKHELVISTFGHAGSGALHPVVLIDAPASEKTQAVVKALSELAETAVGLGGFVAGEYGIGIEKKGLEWTTGPMQKVDLITKTAPIGKTVEDPAFVAMKKLKEAFDPKGILNPGKSFLPGRVQIAKSGLE